MKSWISAAVLAAATLPLLIAAPASASTNTVRPLDVTCTVSITGGGHTVTEKCSGSLSGYSQFRLAVNFCNTSNCAVATGNWANFGGTSKVTSGGYATRDNVATQYR
jgi:hypothetical protein